MHLWNSSCPPGGTNSFDIYNNISNLSLFLNDQISLINKIKQFMKQTEFCLVHNQKESPTNSLVDSVDSSDLSDRFQVR